LDNDGPQNFSSGAWTLIGWPSTTEGAVRIRYLAADAINRREVCRCGFEGRGLMMLLGVNADIDPILCSEPKIKARSAQRMGHPRYSMQSLQQDLYNGMKASNFISLNRTDKINPWRAFNLV